MNDVPEESRSTVELLRRTYPDGIPEADYRPLLYLLYEVGEISMRSLAAALSYYYDRPHVDFFRDIDGIACGWLLPPGLNPEDIDRVRIRLEANGFNEWLLEE